MPVILFSTELGKVVSYQCTYIDTHIDVGVKTNNILIYLAGES